jgi:hypothetical protein
MKFNYEFLPKILIEKLRSLFKSYREYRTCNNLILIVCIILIKNIVDDDMELNDDSYIYSYYPLSVKYWRTVIGTHYSKYLEILLSNNIILCDWVRYVSDTGRVSRVKGYRINPALLNDKFSLIKYLGNKSKSKTSDMIFNLSDESTPMRSIGFKPELITMKKPLAMNFVNNGLSDVVNRYKNKDYIPGVPKTMPVKVRILKEDGSFDSHHMSVEAAQKIAEERGKQFFYYKNKFIIADEQQFDRVVLQNLNANYQWQISSFLPEKYNFRRNKRTLRVYSKLSSLPSALLPFIRINGRYIMQADLKCSQFVLFANLMNFYVNKSGDELVGLFKKKPCKTFIRNLVNIFDQHSDEFPDQGLSTDNPPEDQYDDNNIYKFLIDSLVHDFYGIIRSELNLPQREHGKGIAFRTVFAKPKPENEMVRQLRSLYPSIVSIINDFKNKYGYNQFSIGLQRIEAEVFIDHIWKKVRESGINSFTRHDSIVFPISMKQKVQEIITGVFADFDFIYRIEYEVFNAEEIDSRLVDDTNYIDTMEDYDMTFFYTMFEARKDAKKEAMKQEKMNLLFEQLEDIELPKNIENDYFKYVTLDTLGMIAGLDDLTSETRLSLEEDIANLLSNFPVPFFQDKTNALIRWLVELNM